MNSYLKRRLKAEENKCYLPEGEGANWKIACLTCLPNALFIR